MVIFHSYVSLPEGNMSQELWQFGVDFDPRTLTNSPWITWILYRLETSGGLLAVTTFSRRIESNWWLFFLILDESYRHFVDLFSIFSHGGCSEKLRSAPRKGGFSLAVRQPVWPAWCRGKGFPTIRVPRNHPAICLGFSIVNYPAIGVPPFLCMWKGYGTMYLCICLELWEPKIWSQRTRHGTRGGRCQVLCTTVFLFFHVMAPGQSLQSLAKAQAWTGTRSLSPSTNSVEGVSKIGSMRMQPVLFGCLPFLS